eukprot:11182270-Lingulodinium_polyedra.AAC.1
MLREIIEYLDEEKLENKVAEVPPQEQLQVPAASGAAQAAIGSVGAGNAFEAKKKRRGKKK